MTNQEAEQRLLQELDMAIMSAWSRGVRGDIIAYELRSAASKVAKEWNTALSRRNARRIEEMSKAAN
jgi:hypothetical protein